MSPVAAMIVLCSGGFDPLHDGHLDYLEGAAKYGRVFVALNSDEWLRKKKGWIFMPWSARARILNQLAVVFDVVAVDDSDGTVCDALQRIRPTHFANGGDRVAPNTVEHLLCKELHIEEIFGIGGPKARSSSELIRRRRPGSEVIKDAAARKFSK